MLDIPKFKANIRVRQFTFYRIFLLFLIFILAYIVIYINYWLLGSTIPSSIIWILFISLTVFCLLFYVITYVRYNSLYYTFFDTQMTIHDKKTTIIKYTIIKDISYEQNFIDKKFNTSNIKLITQSGKDIMLRHLSNGNQIFFFLQKKIVSSGIKFK